MEGEEREGDGEEEVKGKGKRLRCFKGVSYVSKSLIFNSPNWGNWEGEKRRGVSLVLKKI
jgi:hypothetical protein